MGRLIVGVGNADRGDDGAGQEVALRMQAAGVDGVVVHDGEAATLMGLWDGFDDVVIVDAISSGRPPGSIVRFDAAAGPLPLAIMHSTHALGPAAAIELARVLERLPANVTVIGIEGAAFGFGEPLSDAVAQAVDVVTEMLRHA